MTMEDEASRFADLLLCHGIKPTANRIIIVEALAGADRPLSMTELEDKVESIDKSNVFRSLNTFREHHLVHTIEDGGDSVRYELCLSTDEGHDDDMHVHFYCEQCHKTFCLPDTPVPSVNLPEGYVMDSVNYVIKGMCAHCAAKR